jgi:hypothetical protein
VLRNSNLWQSVITPALVEEEAEQKEEINT